MAAYAAATGTPTGAPPSSAQSESAAAGPGTSSSQSQEVEEEEEVESGTVAFHSSAAHLNQHQQKPDAVPSAKRAKFMGSGPPPGHPLWEEEQRRLASVAGQEQVVKRTPQDQGRSRGGQGDRGAAVAVSGGRNPVGDGKFAAPGTAHPHTAEIVATVVNAARAAHKSGLDSPNQFHPVFTVAFNSPPSVINHMPLNCRLFLGNLASERTDRFEIAAIFANYGNIVEISLKGSFGFVQYTDPGACTEAIRCEQGRIIGGAKIDLKVSRDKAIFGGRSDERERSPRRSVGRPGSARERSRSRERRDRDRDRRDDRDRDYRDKRDDRRDDRDRKRYDDPDDKYKRKHDDRRDERDYRDGRDRDRDRGDDRRRSPPRGQKSRFDSPQFTPKVVQPGGPGLTGLQQAQLLLQQKNASSLPSFLTQQQTQPPKPTIHTIDLNSLNPSQFLLPRRFGSAVPEVQLILIGNVDRFFVARVESGMKAAGIVVDVHYFNEQHSLRTIVHQWMAEGVRAIVFIEHHHVKAGNISIHTFHPGGKISEYDNISIEMGASLVLQERQARAATANPLSNLLGGAAGLPPQNQHGLFNQQIAAQLAQQQQQQQANPLLGLLANALGAGNGMVTGGLGAQGGLGNVLSAGNSNVGDQQNALLALVAQLQQQVQQTPQQQAPPPQPQLGNQNAGLLGLSNLLQQQKAQTQPQIQQNAMSGLMRLSNAFGSQSQQTQQSQFQQQQPVQQQGQSLQQNHALSGILSLLGNQGGQQVQQQQQPAPQQGLPLQLSTNSFQQQLNALSGLLGNGSGSAGRAGVGGGSTGVMAPVANNTGVPFGTNPNGGSVDAGSGGVGDILSRLKQLQQINQQQR
ncbi:hypothetical protein BC830DRAFT_1171755 [Chytriomyces sp. MP71]|nr:hypothetical protein BC830DRAFT_1171755 [Chytriomyces sp. MP71]